MKSRKEFKLVLEVITQKIYYRAKSPQLMLFFPLQ